MKAQRLNAALWALTVLFVFEHGVVLAGGLPNVRRIEWQKIKLDGSTFESAGVFDVNNDGKSDIVCGGYWYEAPKWSKHKLRDVLAADEYFDDFSTIPMDVNGDGYLDFITGGWWGETLSWIENPKGDPNKEWTKHDIEKVGNIETTRAWDVDGDGELEICPNTPTQNLKFFKLLKNNGKPTGEFKKVVVQPEGSSGHGLGFGDIFGNGKGCFIVNNGIWEPTGDPTNDPWVFHQEFNLGAMASVPILVEDVNGDGKKELIVGMAHGYGLDYYTWEVKDGKRVWTKHPIDPWFSQYHDMQWADIDGDGENELITGNRYRAHCGQEPGETDIVGLFYFKWNGESFTKCVIDYGEVGDHSGTGIFFAVADLDGDGKLDIVAPGKEGLFIFKNQGPEQVGVKN